MAKKKLPVPAPKQPKEKGGKGGKKRGFLTSHVARAPKGSVRLFRFPGAGDLEF